MDENKRRRILTAVRAFRAALKAAAADAELAEHQLETRPDAPGLVDLVEALTSQLDSATGDISKALGLLESMAKAAAGPVERLAREIRLDE